MHVYEKWWGEGEGGEHRMQCNGRILREKWPDNLTAGVTLRWYSSVAAVSGCLEARSGLSSWLKRLELQYNDSNPPASVCRSCVESCKTSPWSCSIDVSKPDVWFSQFVLKVFGSLTRERTVALTVGMSVPYQQRTELWRPLCIQCQGTLECDIKTSCDCALCVGSLWWHYRCDRRRRLRHRHFKTKQEMVHSIGARRARFELPQQSKLRNCSATIERDLTLAKKLSWRDQIKLISVF